MNIIKKYWYIALLLIGTIGLGLTTLLISLRLQQPKPITPDEPKAATQACTLSFSISIPTATLTPTGPPPTATPVPAQCNQTCTTFTNCGTGLTCSGGFCRAPSCTQESDCVCATPTPTLTTTPTGTIRPTNTPAPGSCNAGCQNNNDCSNNLVCSQGKCRNSECTEKDNCACYFVPTPKVPVTGTGSTLLGIGVVAGGLVLLLLGLVF